MLRTPWKSSLLQLMPILLGIVMLLAVVLWNEGAEKRALTELAPAERQSLFETTLESFRALCSKPAGAFTSECRERANFLMKFPECGPDCQALARTQRATR